MSRTVFSVVALNLAIFIGLTSLPAFQALHHHWIFPILAGIFIAQWLAAAAVPPMAWLEPAAARSALLSLLAFLMAMGIVRHWTILTCIGMCSFKLGLSAAMAAPIFLISARRGWPGWGPARCRTAGLICAVAAAWLIAARPGGEDKAHEVKIIFLGLTAAGTAFYAAGRRDARLGILLVLCLIGSARAAEEQVDLVRLFLNRPIDRVPYDRIDEFLAVDGKTLPAALRRPYMARRLELGTLKFLSEVKSGYHSMADGGCPRPPETRSGDAGLLALASFSRISRDEKEFLESALRGDEVRLACASSLQITAPASAGGPRRYFLYPTDPAMALVSELRSRPVPARTAPVSREPPRAAKPEDRAAPPQDGDWTRRCGWESAPMGGDLKACRCMNPKLPWLSRHDQTCSESQPCCESWRHGGPCEKCL